MGFAYLSALAKKAAAGETTIQINLTQ